jgi:ABC-type Fe3+/spermidine/putrescine transport system ATPase subunit
MNRDKLADDVVLENVNRSYGKVHAVKNVSLSVRHGEIVALLGPSGSGKTTLLSMVGGQAQPDDGNITVGGKSIIGLPPDKIDAATVFQDYALFPHLSVLDNVGFGLRVRKVPRDEARRLSMATMLLVGLDGFENRRIDQLSGGQRQRVATARALAVQPSVLLLDEPLGALDRQIRGRLQDELSELLRRLKVTTLLVTHDQAEAFAMADRIAVMRDGRLEQIDSPGTLYRWPKSEFVATFLGGGVLIDATVTGHIDSSKVMAESTAGALQCRVSKSCIAGEAIRVLIRPEHVKLVPTDDKGPATFSGGEIVRIIESGETTRVTVRFNTFTLESVQLGLSSASGKGLVNAIIDPDGPVAIQIQ